MEIVAAAGVPEVSLEGGRAPVSPGVPPTFSGKWDDMAQDMAAIATEGAEPTQPVAQPQQAAATPQAQPEAQPQAPAVPDKFKAPDGTLDQEKVLKSYAEAEKALKRLQNAPQQPERTAQQAQAQQPAPAAQLNPFEAQVAQDLLTEAASNGYQMPQAQAIAQARVMVKMMEAKHKADVAATFSEVAQFRETLADRARKDELESLARTNPWVLTPEGQTDLVKVREENPWLNNSPEPWKAATMYLLGQKSLQATGQVNKPTPSGVQQTAQPLPVTPAALPSPAIQLNSKDDVERYLKTLTPQQEAEFWQKSGYKWETPRKQYMGI